jgi:deoxyribodipyrimidine photolyase-related protein
MPSQSLFFILGNQLFPINLIKKYKKLNFFMAEDMYLCSYEKHHKLKLAFFLSSMREYRDDLKKNNFDINYFQLDSSTRKISYESKLLKLINTKKINHLFFYEIEDKFFEKKIFNLIKKNKLNYTVLQSPMFLNSRSNFVDYIKVGKKPFMSSYYKQQRIKNKILIDSKGFPVGGKWSFDEDNRKKIPKNLILPVKPKIKTNNNLKDVKTLIKKYFDSHPGEINEYWLESNRSKVRLLVKEFVENRLKFFGDFEDAVLKEDIFLFHSFLSPYLNNGLITPKEILEIIFSNKLINKIPINSVEGFVRQLIGWREFMRGIYQNFSQDMEVKNFYGNSRKLTNHWYNGTTGIDPIDDAIKNIIKYGYAHHIIRLMYLSNVMNLCGIDPKEIYRWFMEMFVDSSDWVMSPNVYGMGTFSDGGIFSTKPYICGSNYMIKMSNYKKGNWSSIVDGLYWNFISKNINSIKKNARMSMVVMTYNKISFEKLENHKILAKKFILEKTL